MKRLGLALLVAWAGCHSRSSVAPRNGSAEVPSPTVHDAALAKTGPRIFIVGASVSAGMGGLTFLDAFIAAAPRSDVGSAASIFLFRDPPKATRDQVAAALAFKPTLVIALDLLFWDAYGFAPQAQRRDAIAHALQELDRLHAAGATVVVGDLPHIVTASPMLLDPSSVPPVEELAELNRQIQAWAGPRKLVAPFATWAAPLALHGEVTMPDGSRVAADALMAADGLHANPRGTYYVLTQLDQWLERQGIAADVLQFVAPVTSTAPPKGW